MPVRDQTGEASPETMILFLKNFLNWNIEKLNLDNWYPTHLLQILLGAGLVGLEIALIVLDGHMARIYVCGIWAGVVVRIVTMVLSSIVLLPPLKPDIFKFHLNKFNHTSSHQCLLPPLFYAVDFVLFRFSFVERYVRLRQNLKRHLW